MLRSAFKMIGAGGSKAFMLLLLPWFVTNCDVSTPHSKSSKVDRTEAKDDIEGDSEASLELVRKPLRSALKGGRANANTEWANAPLQYQDPPDDSPPVPTKMILNKLSPPSHRQPKLISGSDEYQPAYRSDSLGRAIYRGGPNDLEFVYIYNAWMGRGALMPYDKGAPSELEFAKKARAKALEMERQIPDRPLHRLPPKIKAPETAQVLEFEGDAVRFSRTRFRLSTGAMVYTDAAGFAFIRSATGEFIRDQVGLPANQQWAVINGQLVKVWALPLASR